MIPFVTPMLVSASAGTTGELDYVGGRTFSDTGTASGTHSISLTSLTGGIASAPAAGDLVVIVLHYPAATNLDIAVSGYTEVFDIYANDSYDSNLGGYYKVMGATPDTTVDVPVSGSTSNGLNVAIQVWRGINPATPIDTAAITFTGVDGAAPNPPAITPSVEGAPIIAVGAQAIQAFYTPGLLTSSDLENFQNVRDLASNIRGTLGMGSKIWAGPAAFNAAAFGNFNNVATTSATAAVFALKPA